MVQVDEPSEGTSVITPQHHLSVTEVDVMLTKFILTCLPTSVSLKVTFVPVSVTEPAVVAETFNFLVASKFWSK